MKKLLLALVLLLLIAPRDTYSRKESRAMSVRKELAFSLMPSGNSALITFAILTWYGDDERPSDVRIITRNDFLAIAHGLAASEANPTRENLFVKYEVKDCASYIDTIGKSTTYDCSVVDDLWKLRYKLYPIKSAQKIKILDKVEVPEVGWANMPFEMSWEQLGFLEKYGIRSRNDFFYGANAFRLLKDMQDPDWISVYAKL
jgi:hypothetical protein